MGQGLSVVLAQITAEELGLPVDHVRVLLSDTDLTPDGGPTTASRQTYVSGNAARYAAVTMREALTSVAAERMSVPPQQIRFENGRLRYNGSAVDMGEVVIWMHEQGLEAKVRYAYDAPTTQPLGTGGDMHFAFSYATQAALVEVDMETGAVKVLKVIAANDVGRAINPKTLNGQVQGGIAMGLGNCLTEEYIVENGVPWSTLFALQDSSIKHAGDLASGRRTDQPGPTARRVEIRQSTHRRLPTPDLSGGRRVYRIPVDQDALLRDQGRATVHDLARRR
jgi:xanthine dehydrogenase molybdenum-binding subunit